MSPLRSFSIACGDCRKDYVSWVALGGRAHPLSSLVVGGFGENEQLIFLDYWVSDTDIASYIRCTVYVLLYYRLL